MKIHCDKKGLYWYVHISKYRNIDGCYLLSRGDSDPMVLYQGVLYDYWTLEMYLEDMFNEDRNTWYEDCAEDEGDEYPYKNVDDWIECFDLNPADILWNGNQYKHQNERSKTLSNMRQRLSAEEKRVMALSKILPNIDNKADAHKYMVCDDCWDNHHCNNLTFSQTIKDYQVLRVFDVEIDYVEPIEKYATEEEIGEMDKEEEKTGGYCDDTYERIMERIWDEVEDPYHEYEVGEIVQYWINVNTGNMVMLGKVCNDTNRYCDMDADWEIIRMSTKRGQAFAETFWGRFGSGHYKDLSIHPKLYQRGWRGLNAMNWYYGADGDSNASNENKLFNAIDNQVGFLQFMKQLVTEGNEWERKFKQYGFENVIDSMEDERISSDNYLAALKIAKRNKYIVTDKTMWRDLLYALLALDKDIHNSHYVCPADLKADHDKWLNVLHKKQEKERQYRMEQERIRRERAEAERLERNKREAESHAQKYLEHIAKYSNLCIENDKYKIFVCPSVSEMAEEGIAMGHCVFSMGYYKKTSSLILFCRDKETDHRETTIEMSLTDWKIIQCYAKGNKIHKDNEVIRNLLMDNIRLFQDAKKKRKPRAKVVPIKQQNEQLAMAA